jgi:hypothetical protein
MATVPRSIAEELPVELHSGDRMTQPEFHCVYARMPEDFKAELIGGIVYVASPLKRSHGTRHTGLNTVLGIYQAHTPGVEAGDNTTLILGKEDEAQPDAYLRILPEFGGQSLDSADEYIKGAPELLSEISLTSRSIDLHGKRDRYQNAGVVEYIVVCLRPPRLFWFDLKTARDIAPGADGVSRSVVFPGLWIDGQALLDLDYPRLMAVLNHGLATPEHAAFVSGLANARSVKEKT